MSTEHLANIATILPNSRTSTVKNIGTEANKPSVPSVDQVDENIAVSGNKVPSDQTLISQNTDSRLDRLDSAVSDINSYVETVNRTIQFTIDDALPLGRSVIKVIDSETEEVIREFPDEAALELARKINEQTEENISPKGLIFSEKA